MIKRSTLRSQIAVALRDEILAGRLATGRDFTVKEIAEQYGVSATPVREALVDLAAQGLLDVEQHRGFRVHEFTLADYRAMCEARELVVDGVFRGVEGAAEGAAEAPDGALRGAASAPAGGEAVSSGGEAVSVGRAVARRAFGGLGPEVVRSVRRRADAAERAARAGDLDVLIAYDLRYWRELSGLLGNPYVCDFLDRLRVQCWVYAVPVLRRHASLRGRLWSGHNALLDAVESGDARAAREVVAAYNRHALAQVGADGAAPPPEGEPGGE
ncbi:GntR family transcriptional regulator [Streptomyces qinglanensis]|uniref:DNA-binding transcriptional regulator, GntR family n=1 Tax=Streptomyces qinglanensis TaxID=943816 RepID=A0A1H9PNB0_9ACTN|nr:GntR family transcriptional regulator [Streptomyces qinglanensis]SER49806.1 DNA-binding transcriptional regulator, GntR family [Streptomyces qinglanensis]